MAKLNIPPIQEVRAVELTKDERFVLDGLIQTLFSAGQVEEQDADFFKKLSDKLVTEEEAASYLQDLGFTIVKKGKARA
jgi:hypothetical protein